MYPEKKNRKIVCCCPVRINRRRSYCADRTRILAMQRRSRGICRDGRMRTRTSDGSRIRSGIEVARRCSTVKRPPTLGLLSTGGSGEIVRCDWGGFEAAYAVWFYGRIVGTQEGNAVSRVVIRRVNCPFLCPCH